MRYPPLAASPSRNGHACAQCPHAPTPNVATGSDAQAAAGLALCSSGLQLGILPISVIVRAPHHLLWCHDAHARSAADNAAHHLFNHCAPHADLVFDAASFQDRDANCDEAWTCVDASSTSVSPCITQVQSDATGRFISLDDRVYKSESPLRYQGKDWPLNATKGTTLVGRFRRPAGQPNAQIAFPVMLAAAGSSAAQRPLRFWVEVWPL